MKGTTPGTVLRTGDLRGRGSTPFEIVPGREALRAMARDLGLPELRSLRFAGRIEPSGREDWRLDGHLSASVVQSCVITLDPVASRIEEEVERLYLAHWTEPEEAEVAMPDDAREPLPAAIDLMAVAAEALALALPAYPRAPGASLGRAAFAEEGVAPLGEEDVKPFAGLAALRDRLSGDG